MFATRQPGLSPVPDWQEEQLYHVLNLKTCMFHSLDRLPKQSDINLMPMIEWILTVQFDYKLLFFFLVGLGFLKLNCRKRWLCSVAGQSTWLLALNFGVMAIFQFVLSFIIGHRNLSYDGGCRYISHCSTMWYSWCYRKTYFI